MLITYHLPVCYIHRIQKYPVNTTYNTLTQLKKKPKETIEKEHRRLLKQFQSTSFLVLESKTLARL